MLMRSGASDMMIHECAAKRMSVLVVSAAENGWTQRSVEASSDEIKLSLGGEVTPSPTTISTL